MSLGILLLVLFAALMHASWNVLVKSGEDKFLSSVLIATGAAVIAGPALLFLPAPAVASWPFIALSTVLQVIYYFLLSAAYHGGEMNRVYPLMRGTAPLLVVALSGWLLGETLHPAALVAVVALCAGVLGLIGDPRVLWRSGNATRYALANAVVIASYSLTDGHGVRLSGAPEAYTLWIFFTQGVAMFGWAAFARRREFFTRLRQRWPVALGGGGLSIASYGLALMAMTQAPVALVAALRESSILFGILLARLLLKEKISASRVFAVALIVAGVIGMRLA
jgi:drug/metabolite transporter (DMT)-like permease